MKLIDSTDWNRRDFTAHLECEHCGHKQKVSGYDDQNYYENVVPGYECPQCHKTGTKTEGAVQTRYCPSRVI